MSEHPYKSSGRPIGAETVMMLRRCERCDKLFAPLTAECSSCGSWDLQWSPSTGHGSVVSSRLVHRGMSRPHAQLVPLTIAIVELDEGPWVYATIDGDVAPFADGPVRVRFEPRPPVDRFPVFVVCPATPSREDSVRSAPQGGSAADDGRSPGSVAGPRYDAWWVRTSLRQCEVMEGAKSLDAAAKSLVGFAIRWAPFGGATASELLVTFGVTRRRFLHMVDEALRPRRADSVAVRGLKHHLQLSLAQAWRMSPAACPGGRP